MPKDRRPQKSYDILILGALTLLASVSWIGFEVYRNASVKPDVSPVTDYQTRVLNPSLDTSVLDTLQKRLVISQTEVPTQTTEPVSSQGGSLQTATKSGTL